VNVARYTEVMIRIATTTVKSLCFVN
jgi:hypothetical protein